jgi:formyltetrahydrofolate synthetase
MCIRDSVGSEMCIRDRRMPGLPAVPNAERIDIDNDGKIIGLS